MPRPLAPLATRFALLAAGAATGQFQLAPGFEETLQRPARNPLRCATRATHGQYPSPIDWTAFALLGEESRTRKRADQPRHQRSLKIVATRRLVNPVVLLSSPATEET